MGRCGSRAHPSHQGESGTLGRTLWPDPEAGMHPRQQQETVCAVVSTGCLLGAQVSQPRPRVNTHGGVNTRGLLCPRRVHTRWEQRGCWGLSVAWEWFPSQGSPVNRTAPQPAHHAVCHCLRPLTFLRVGVPPRAWSLQAGAVFPSQVTMHICNK